MQSESLLKKMAVSFDTLGYRWEITTILSIVTQGTWIIGVETRGAGGRRASPA
jgi:hypothetical protein